MPLRIGTHTGRGRLSPDFFRAGIDVRASVDADCPRRDGGDEVLRTPGNWAPGYAIARLRPANCAQNGLRNAPRGASPVQSSRTIQRRSSTGATVGSIDPFPDFISGPQATHRGISEDPRGLSRNEEASVVA